MTTTNTETVLAADGVSGITGVINNLTGTAQMVGAAVVVLVIVIVGIMIGVGALSQGGSMRKHMTAILGVAVACLVIGGGTAIAPMLVQTGQDLPKNTNTQTGGVN